MPLVSVKVSVKDETPGDGETELLGERDEEGETLGDILLLGLTDGDGETDGEAELLGLSELLGLMLGDSLLLGLADDDGDTDGDSLELGLTLALGDTLGDAELEGLTLGDGLTLAEGEPARSNCKCVIPVVPVPPLSATTTRRIPDEMSHETATLFAGQFAALWMVPSASAKFPAVVLMPLSAKRSVVSSLTEIRATRAALLSPRARRIP